VPGSAAMDSTIQEGDESITEIKEELKALRRDFEDLKLKMTAFMEQFK
jgi:archaellum component FlaC